MDRDLVLKLIASGLVAGFMSGFFGVGGGIVLVPLILLVLKSGQHRAHASSLAAIVIIAVSGAVTFARSGSVDVGAGVLIGVGGVVGSTVGAQVMHRMSASMLRAVFAAFLIIAGVRMVVA